ncbi:tRNA (N6-isopentenyl adenosine(37)-C2)-methylthiotransferase MiaB [Halobacteriovorax marinus]|uniref:tRNA-2-methylthio-N(6)-dimethylallyladenosine synthase n=1 Tax=Halobacteriovorax marinus TaxID=97084 RepID=A0A1Y5FC54_9BACT|nr:tRNA (N6-isopentenyl adenosine(37)-C2)-methylthiotransferase MiaB [Halobacteriovorax marinus]
MDTTPSGLGLRDADGPTEEWFTDQTTGQRFVKMGDIVFPPRKVWMKTYGCQMNYHDTDRIIDHLKSLNFTQALEVEDADLVLFNTCAVRDLANNKFYSHLGNMKHQKALKKDKLVVGVGGCVAQTEGKELIKKYRHLDFAFGPDTIDSINDMVYRTYAGDSKFFINNWDRSENFSIQTKISHGTPQAFVNIIKGCNKYCTYCIVPYTRGKERSRKLDEVVEDIRRLVKYQGIQEVTLLGQNVNSYGKENGESLAQLILELEKLDGLELIRYTTSHPYDISDDLIKVHGISKKLSKHLHLPVQSGSNTVLKRMNREYTIEHYLDRIAKLKEAQPEIIISTDIIAGFLNETDEEHQDTLKLLDTAKFDFIYSYAYSKRNKTRAARSEDHLTKEIRSARLREIQLHQLDLQAVTREKLVGKTFRILVEGKNTFKDETKWKGRTNCNRIIHFLPSDEDENLQWHWVNVEVTSTTALSCQGKFISDLGKKLIPIQ